MCAIVPKVPRQFVRFLFAGGIAAAANYGSRFLFSHWVGYELAIILAYLVGMLVAFMLMRGHVFAAKGKALVPQVGKFIGINIKIRELTIIKYKSYKSSHFSFFFIFSFFIQYSKYNILNLNIIL